MHAREAIVRLIDNHANVVGLNRRQLADLSDVNPGQLSNWLRVAGPLSQAREGRVAQQMLERAQVALEADPKTKATDEISQLASVLRSFGPRRRWIASRPEAARSGEPISPGNPLFRRRPCDDLLTAQLECEGGQAVSVRGGPKTGKSSLLLLAQERMESRATVLFVDLAEYRGSRPEGVKTDEAETHFFNWLAARCEEQLRGGSGATWDEATDIIPWMRKCALTASRGKRVILVLDHLDRLGEHYAGRDEDPDDGRGEDPDGQGSQFLEFWALDRAARILTENRRLRREDADMCQVDFLLAVDPFSIGIPRHLDAGGSSLFDSRTTKIPDVEAALNLEEPEMGNLLKSAGADEDRAAKERGDAWRLTGGQVWLAQAYASTTSARASRQAVIRAARDLAGEALNRWGKNLALDIAEDRLWNDNGTASSPDARRALVSTGLCARGRRGITGHDREYWIHAIAAKTTVREFTKALDHEQREVLG